MKAKILAKKRNSLDHPFFILEGFTGAHCFSEEIWRDHEEGDMLDIGYDPIRGPHDFLNEANFDPELPAGWPDDLLVKAREANDRTDQTEKIEIELTEKEAYYFALFIKRTSWSTFEEHSAPGDESETQQIADAVCAVQRGFRDAGYAPR